MCKNMSLICFIACILPHIFIEGYPNIQPDIGIRFLKMKKFHSNMALLTRLFEAFIELFN